MAVRRVWGAVALLVFFSLVASAELTETQAQVGNDLAALRAEVSRLYGQGNYAAALWIAERYVAAARQHHGEEHIEFASAITWLAYVYQAQGRYAEAEPLHQRALAIREKVFGADHPDVGVPRTERLLADGKGALQERLGLGIATLDIIKVGEVVEGGGDGEMLGAECLL